MPHSIETLDLTKRFRRRRDIRSMLSPWTGQEVVAVDHATLSVKSGELFGLLGPNGAGKTTLIKLLSTLVVPNSGEALVNGFPLTDGENVRRQIGLVGGEERSFYWRLSGVDNLRFYASLYGLSHGEADKRIKQLSELLGLDEFLDGRFDTYSAGMKQRLALARGLLNEAEILFLDEPTKSLDPGAAMRLRETIHDLSRKRGHTVVLVTHQLREAEQMCDRIGIMNRGRLTVADEVGRLKELVRPETQYRLQVTGLSGDAISRVGRLEGVIELSTEAQSEGEAVLYLRVVEDKSSLPRVLRAIWEHGGEIEGIGAEDVTLEEIFEEFTGDQSCTLDSGEPSCLPALQVHGGPRPLKQPVPRSVRVLDNVRSGLRKVWAFVGRDFKLQTSYRLAFFFQVFGILFSVASFYFVALLFGDAAVPYLQLYGGGTTSPSSWWGSRSCDTRVWPWGPSRPRSAPGR